MVLYVSSLDSYAYELEEIIKLHTPTNSPKSLS
jgi:hypothetical protein